MWIGVTCRLRFGGYVGLNAKGAVKGTLTRRVSCVRAVSHFRRWPNYFNRRVAGVTLLVMISGEIDARHTHSKLVVRARSFRHGIYICVNGTIYICTIYKKFGLS